MRWIALILCTGLGACGATVAPNMPTTAPGLPIQMLPAQEMQSFAQVVRAVEPVAERVCRQRTSGANCDFQIIIDPDRNAAPNAYQSLDKTGRPIITFTQSLINDTKNANELAFVLGHEAAHHISGHLYRQQNNALAGAVIFAGLTALTGGTVDDIQTAQELGAMVGARSYSKDFELEADQLGTVITYYSGYNPLVGSRFFSRIRDPGDQFLGTHPPNAARLDTVRRTSAQLGIPGA